MRLILAVVLLSALAFGVSPGLEKPAPSAASEAELLLDGDYGPRVLELIRGAQREIRTLLYLAQGDPESRSPRALLQALVDARTRGVQVSVLLDLDVQDRAKNEAALAFLKAGGVRVRYDDPETTTHAKALEVDGEWLVVGSANWTQGALRHNHEAGVLLRSPELARKFAAYAQRLEVPCPAP